MTINEWGTRYGKKRRALDRKLLAEAEAQIPSPDDAAPCTDGRFASQATRMPKPPERPTTLDRNMRLTIAKAFGRPPT
jgi:hypothetical protein